MKKKFDKCSDTKSYKETLKSVFDSLNICDEDQQLLFDVYTNEMSKEELSIKYNISSDILSEKINSLTIAIRNNCMVNNERNNRNLRGR